MWGWSHSSWRVCSVHTHNTRTATCKLGHSHYFHLKVTKCTLLHVSISRQMCFSRVLYVNVCFAFQYEIDRQSIVVVGAWIVNNFSRSQLNLFRCHWMKLWLWVWARDIRDSNRVDRVTNVPYTLRLLPSAMGSPWSFGRYWFSTFLHFSFHSVFSFLCV